MNDDYPDLLPIISDARRLVGDDRLIWCSASDGFDSRRVQKRGLLIGGAISPHFLRDTPGMWSEVPWMVRLQNCRVVICDEAAHAPIASWLPLMEAIVAARESLLVVTETIGSELLHTFVVNALKATLPVCVVHPIGIRANPSAHTESPGRSNAARLEPRDRLPLIHEAWIRRTASALFPDEGEAAPFGSALQDFAVIETGGENYEDQRDRLRFLMRELQG